MEVNAENLKSIVAQGHEMARAGHFDSAGILKAVKDFDRRCEHMFSETFKTISATVHCILMVSKNMQLRFS